MAGVNDSTMALLRSSTWDLHQAVEGHGFQQSLVKGSLTRVQYIRFLGQMLLIHTALERHLRGTATRWPFCQIVNNRLFREQLLLSDLDFFGVDGRRVEAEPATVELIARIDHLGVENPIALLGMLYVLEGSTNGGKWIARAARKAYGLNADTGAAYFDPYGDQQRSEWQGFKERVDKLELTETQRGDLVDAAKEMFAGLSRISDDLVHEPATERIDESVSGPAPRCPFTARRP